MSLLVAALAVAGCGNAPDDSRSSLSIALESGRGLLAQRQSGAQPLQPTAGFPGVDPALVAGVTAPLLGAWLPSRQTLATLAPSLVQGDRTFWTTADGVTFTLQGGGMAVATRGLGADLHASDTTALQALIAAGHPGQGVRYHLYIDGAYGEQHLRLNCTVQPDGQEALQINTRSFRTIRMVETCTGSGPHAEIAITNRYWRDMSGPMLRQSAQWLGPQLGYLYLQRLVE